MRQYVPDAFTDKVFAGNSAAVCGSGGALYCTREGGRIRMSGRAALYAVSDIFVD